MSLLQAKKASCASLISTVMRRTNIFPQYEYKGRNCLQTCVLSGKSTNTLSIWVFYRHVERKTLATGEHVSFPQLPVTVGYADSEHSPPVLFMHWNTVVETIWVGVQQSWTSHGLVVTCSPVLIIWKLSTHSGKTKKHRGGGELHPFSFLCCRFKRTNVNFYNSIYVRYIVKCTLLIYFIDLRPEIIFRHA